MSEDIAEIANRLAEHAEAVCRRYLWAGRRERHQWRVGDIHNTPGRSLFVRLNGPTFGKDAAGRWRDAATDESGDLIDLIKETQGLASFADALAEARRFLNLPEDKCRKRYPKGDNPNERFDPMISVARLVAESRSLHGSLAEIYLHRRGIAHLGALDALHFHPHCPYRDPSSGQFSQWPALLSLVTDLNGSLTGLQRTYLSPNGDGKANVSAPRRSLGAIRSHGVRFGRIQNVGVYGEGVETLLSIKCALPTMPMVAALSADNLGASSIPATLRRLYVAVDPDPAGLRAEKTLSTRFTPMGIQVVPLLPLDEDFNADLTTFGIDAVRRRLAAQLLPEDLEHLGKDYADTALSDGA